MDFYCSLIDWAKENPDSICGRIYAWLENKYREILENKGSLTCYDPDFGELTWPLEEGSFLKVIKEYPAFFEEIIPFADKFISDKALLSDILKYQKAVVKNPYSKRSELELQYDFYKFFTEIYNGNYSALIKRENKISLDSEEVSADLIEFAKDTVWFGRKGGQNIISKINYM